MSKETSSKAPLGDASNLLNLPGTSGRVVKHTASAKPSKALKKAAEDYSTKSEFLLANCIERSEALLNKFKDHDWIIDSKTTFSLRKGTFKKDQETPPKSDYEPKLNVWIGFSNKGVCLPFISKFSDKIDQETYLNKCVKKRLVPFVTQNHADLNKTVLWADPDSFCHAKPILAHLDEQKIKYVDKNDNPGYRVKCQQYFWNYLRNRVYNNGDWWADDEDELEERIRECISEELDMDRVASIANDTQKRIEEMTTKGAIKEWSDSKRKYSK